MLMRRLVFPERVAWEALPAVRPPEFVIPFALFGILVLGSTFAARRLLGSRQEA